MAQCEPDFSPILKTSERGFSGFSLALVKKKNHVMDLLQSVCLSNLQTIFTSSLNLGVHLYPWPVPKQIGI